MQEAAGHRQESRAWPAELEGLLPAVRRTSSILHAIACKHQCRATTIPSSSSTTTTTTTFCSSMWAAMHVASAAALHAPHTSQPKTSQACLRDVQRTKSSAANHASKIGQLATTTCWCAQLDARRWCGSTAWKPTSQPSTCSSSWSRGSPSSWAPRSSGTCRKWLRACVHCAS